MRLLTLALRVTPGVGERLLNETVGRDLQRQRRGFRNGVELKLNGRTGTAFVGADCPLDAAGERQVLEFGQS